MTLNIQKTSGNPPRILIYGVEGIGKSTFAASADTPVFLQLEDGLDSLNADAFPVAKTYKEAMDNLESLTTNEHDFKTLCIDSLDAFEYLIWQKVCEENNVEKISIIPYGRGYDMALDIWHEYWDLISYIRDTKKMTIIQIGHSNVVRFENPQTEPYDRYEVRLHKKARDYMVAQSDIVLFANYHVGIKKDADKSGQKDEDKRRRAIGSGERVLYTEERPAFIAKNRYSLPSEIIFDKDGKYWDAIAQNIPFFNRAK